MVAETLDPFLLLPFDLPGLYPCTAGFIDSHTHFNRAAELLLGDPNGFVAQREQERQVADASLSEPVARP